MVARSVEFANEYFTVCYLATMFKAWNNDFEGKLEIEKGYLADFIKLLHRYKKDIDKLDPLAFANIIYLIEKSYFKHPWGIVVSE